ncbi:nucleotidyltransferase [Chryseobacterium sp. Alg-005]
MAGGLGSRYKGLKQIDGILDNGAPVSEYSIYDALEAGFHKVVVIINRLIPQSYKDRLETISKQKNFELHWVYQDMNQYVPRGFDMERKKPWGTGHAVLCAKEFIDTPFAMINADDFYGKAIYKTASQEIDAGNITGIQFEMIAYPVESTLSENGAVARGICTFDAQNRLLKVVEQTSIRKESGSVLYTDNGRDIIIPPQTLVSMNFFVFHPRVFDLLEEHFANFIKSDPSAEQEFYIPSAVQQMIDDGEVNVLIKSSPSSWKGMTYADDKKILKEFLEKETAMNRYPKDLWG